MPRPDQRERGAAPPVEPAADVDEDRRVERPIAEEPDEESVAYEDRPDIAARRYHQPQRDHRRPEDHRAPDPEPLGQGAYQDATEPGAEPGQGAGERHQLARGAKVLRDRLQPDHDCQRRAEADGQQAERDPDRDPRLARLDALEGTRWGGVPRRGRSDEFRHRPAYMLSFCSDRGV